MILIIHLYPMLQLCFQEDSSKELQWLELYIESQRYYFLTKALQALMSKQKKNFYKIKDSKNLEKITRIFFNNRRKMIRKPYNQIFNGDMKVLDKLKLNLNLRPQNLDCDTYFKLANEYEKLIG